MQLYAFLEARLPDSFREQVQSGNVVIGEVGIQEPGATAEPVSNGFAIEVFSGSSDLFYSLSRALYAQARIFPGLNDIVQHPVASLEQTLAAIEAIYRTYMRRRKIAKPAGYAISQAQKEPASSLALHAQAFVVAHEVGHVQSWQTGSTAPRGSSPKDELDADKTAAVIALGVMGGRETVSLREAYAGAEFAVRVFAGLEHLGHRFDADTHPLPTRRLEHIRNVTKDLCFTRRNYVRLSTIAMAHDQLLEEMERRLLKPGADDSFVVGITSDRLLSTISVLVEEFARSKITWSFAASQLDQACVATPFTVVRQAAVEAANMYFVDALLNPSPEDEELARQEAGFFELIVGRLHGPSQVLFEQAIRQAKAKGPAPAIWMKILESPNNPPGSIDRP